MWLQSQRPLKPWCCGCNCSYKMFFKTLIGSLWFIWLYVQFFFSHMLVVSLFVFVSGGFESTTSPPPFPSPFTTKHTLYPHLVQFGVLCSLVLLSVSEVVLFATLLSSLDIVPNSITPLKCHLVLALFIAMQFFPPLCSLSSCFNFTVRKKNLFPLHCWYFLKWTDVYLNIFMLAVRFTWLKRSKLVKLLLWRKYEWTMRERGYIFDLNISLFITLWVHNVFYLCFASMVCFLISLLCFYNFFSLYMLFNEPKSEVTVKICCYSCSSELYCKFCHCSFL